MLQRRAGNPREPAALLNRSLQELSTALEEIRVAQEQIVENRFRLEQMQVELQRQNERYWQLFDEIPAPYVVTRADAAITEANKAASELFNVSQRFLVGKALTVFVCEDRAGFLTRLDQISSHQSPLEFELKLRPRERAPLRITARVNGDANGLRWLLQPIKL